jgi:nucleotide-binding universal stress UspA family protein
MPRRIAYMPLETYPEAPTDAAIRAAAGFAAALGFGLHVATFAVDIPRAVSPLGGVFLDADGLARAAEVRSDAECERLRALLGEGGAATVTKRLALLGGAPSAAAAEARYFDLALQPWPAATSAGAELAQALVFGAGRPTLLAPQETTPAPLTHVAVAWDESAVAARALGDALALLAPGGRISVLTVGGEKALSGPDLAERLAAVLAQRGWDARPVSLTLSGRSIAAALQDGARAEGAQLLAMGGFGHSRLRDFILGGATRGVLSDLRLPVLLSH